jgi:membrane-bound serine protease (ClpP class)
MPMFLKIIVGIIVAYLLFEIVEHAIIPLSWLVLKKKRKHVTGPLGLIGEVGEIREWNGTEGKIFVHGSIWAATSDDPFIPGDRAEVLDVEGLVLKIKPITG